MTDAQPDVLNSWLKFLHPQGLKTSLMASAIYLAAWETFEHAIIEHIKGFFWVGFDVDGDRFSEKYKTHVLSKDKSVFRASMLWFKEQGAVDDADFALADRARQHRNDIAHNMPAYVTQADRNVDAQLLGDLCGLLGKIDVWWIRNIEVPTNPDFDDQDMDAIPDSEIVSGNMMFLKMLFDTAMGDDAAAWQVYQKFATSMGVQVDNSTA